MDTNAQTAPVEVVQPIKPGSLVLPRGAACFMLGCFTGLVAAGILVWTIRKKL